MSTIIILVLVCALVGGLANALLAWLKEKPLPPFDGGSFAASAIVSLGAAAAIAVGFNYSGITNIVLACLGAFIAGMGGNGLVSGVAGAVVSKPAGFMLGAWHRRVANVSPPAK